MKKYYEEKEIIKIINKHIKEYVGNSDEEPRDMKLLLKIMDSFRIDTTKNICPICGFNLGNPLAECDMVDGSGGNKR